MLKEYIHLLSYFRGREALRGSPLIMALPLRLRPSYNRHPSHPPCGRAFALNTCSSSGGEDLSKSSSAIK